MAHNPEVAGSNPAPATKARGPLSNRKRASGPSFINRFCKSRARLRCLASTSAVAAWSSCAELVISNEVSDLPIRRLQSGCLRPACCRMFLGNTKYQGAGPAPRYARRWPGVSARAQPWRGPPGRTPGRTRSGMQIKMVHSASKLVLAGGRLPRRTIIPLAAAASKALPSVASHAIGFADLRHGLHSLGLGAYRG
jgi:hypothetical protein